MKSANQSRVRQSINNPRIVQLHGRRRLTRPNTRLLGPTNRMLFNSKNVKQAFDNAAEGKHYLNHDDLEVFFIELFGQRPSERLLSQICNVYDVKSAELPVGVSLPKITAFLKEELGCNIDTRSNPNESEFLALFQALDSRGSSFITLKDFVGKVNCRVLRGSLRSAFRIFDVDGDGRVSYRDFIDGIRTGSTTNS